MTRTRGLVGAVRRGEGGHDRKFGRADIRIEWEPPLLHGLGEVVWMSDGGKVTAIPPASRWLLPPRAAPSR